MVQILKKINELTVQEMQELFFSSFPETVNIIGVKENIVCNYDDGFLKIYNSDTGFYLCIWDNYENFSFGNDMDIKRPFKLLNIISSLINMDVIKINK